MFVTELFITELLHFYSAVFQINTAIKQQYFQYIILVILHHNINDFPLHNNDLFGLFTFKPFL